MRTSWGSATDRGTVREVNEDAVLTYPPVFLVADGMGGHDAGDLASRIAVEEFAQLAGQDRATGDDVRDCFDRTSARIRAEFTHGRQGGTTVAGVALTRDEGGQFWLVFNLGDSRVYRWTVRGLEQVSVDHSVVQELMDSGVLTREEADRHPERHVLTRALGTDGPPEPDYWLLPANDGDRLLLCTDGLTRELGAADIAAVLGTRVDPQTAAVALVDEALSRGARDNVTVVVVDVVDESADPMLARSFDEEHPTVSRAAGRGWDEMLDGATVPRQSPGNGAR
ncbi:MAG: protein phosphatase 2C domain-containing protein [Actinobacteria bacterium]|nr:protein phosphatase 2C domain-containing protein [Actinomycetota bacterium]MCG2801269.1 protein phosphatase 2C domain-containing protein [Cellulomonas sp.]